MAPYVKVSSSRLAAESLSNSKFDSSRLRQLKPTPLDLRSSSRPKSTYWGRLPGLCATEHCTRSLPDRGLNQRFHDNSSTDISSTTLRLQTFRQQTFRLLLYTRLQDSYTSNFCFSKSLFSSNPASTYTMIPFINSTSTDAMIIQHI